MWCSCRCSMPERFALTDMAAAHRRLESGAAVDKVVVDIG